jgi:hypothetical protein
MLSKKIAALKSVVSKCFTIVIYDRKGTLGFAAHLTIVITTTLARQR